MDQARVRTPVVVGFVAYGVCAPVVVAGFVAYGVCAPVVVAGFVAYRVWSVCIQ
jgi:hypothetical protein